MENNRFNLERLQARLAEWYKLMPSEARRMNLVGAVSRRDLEAAVTVIHVDFFQIYYVHCGGCGGEFIATLEEAVLFHRVGDPRYLCKACSEAYDRCVRRQVLEWITAPGRVREALAALEATGGRGKLEEPLPKTKPRTGDPAFN